MPKPTVIFYSRALRYPNGINYSVSEEATVTLQSDIYVIIEKKTKGTVSFKLSAKK